MFEEHDTEAIELDESIDELADEAIEDELAALEDYGF